MQGNSTEIAASRRDCPPRFGRLAKRRRRAYIPCMSLVLSRIRLAAFLMLAAALVWFAARSLAPASDAWRFAAASDDPVALADARLDRALTPARYTAALDAALAAGDDDLARSFVALGQSRGLSATAAQQARLDSLQAEGGETTAAAFAEGFLHGARDSGAAATGALAGDISGYGDLRDLWSEADKARRGERVDEVTVGLATAGLALSAVTWSSIGALLPARSGLTILKRARLSGRLAAPLVTSTRAAVAGALDREALAAGFSAAAKLDLVAARAAAARVLRPGALAGLRTLGADAATIYRRAGAKGLEATLAVAENAGEVGKAARLAVAKGGATRAILATLGRGALVFAGFTAAAVEAVFVFLGSLFGLAALAQRFGFWLGRRI